VTERGRKRRRLVAVDLAPVRARLRTAGEADLAAWGRVRVRAILREGVGESTFEIWLAPLELIAVDLAGTLIVSAPAETVGWVARRFGAVLGGAGQRADRSARIADKAECKAAETLAPATAAASAAPVDLTAAALFGGPRSAANPLALSDDVLIDRPPPTQGDQSTDQPTYTSAYPSSYTDV
jgi:hypothetical protein